MFNPLLYIYIYICIFELFPKDRIAHVLSPFFFYYMSLYSSIYNSQNWNFLALHFQLSDPVHGVVHSYLKLEVPGVPIHMFRQKTTLLLPFLCTKKNGIFNK